MSVPSVQRVRVQVEFVEFAGGPATPATTQRNPLRGRRVGLRLTSSLSSLLFSNFVPAVFTAQTLDIGEGCQSDRDFQPNSYQPPAIVPAAFLVWFAS